jgi:hypothetical protein
MRPIQPLIYDPNNPEHDLIDVITEEIHQLESPEVYYWSVIKQETAISEEIPGAGGYLDELDKVYGEKSSGDGVLMFREGKRMYGKLETNPIIQELARMGLSQIEQIDFYVNIALSKEILGEAPKPGDIFSKTALIRNEAGELKKERTFYEVGAVNPVDIYNYQFINYQIEAEQTSLDQIPDSIKKFFDNN